MTHIDTLCVIHTHIDTLCVILFVCGKTGAFCVGPKLNPKLPKLNPKLPELNPKNRGLLRRRERYSLDLGLDQHDAHPSISGKALPRGDGGHHVCPH